MSSADPRSQNDPETGTTKTKTTRPGTSKNPTVRLVAVKGEQSCAFCMRWLYLVFLTNMNPDIGFVCLDCSKPKPYKELTPLHPNYVLVKRWWGLYWEQVLRTSLSHYHTCNGTGCERLIAKENGQFCSHECARFPKYLGCSPASTQPTNSLTYGDRRGLP